ncbi:hypothetical protein D3C80_1726120 [compost metagenome]
MVAGALGGVGHEVAHFLQAEASLLSTGDDLQRVQCLLGIVAIAVAQAPGADQATGFVEADA